MSSTKVVDLFSGVGGFSLGFAQEGFDVELAVDSNEPTLDTYEKNFPETKTAGVDLAKADIRDVLLEAGLQTGEIDVVIGGPPCQGFSVMGKQREDDERNHLLLYFAEHVIEISPSYFVLENVPGLLSDTGKEYLEEFLSVIESEGYNIVREIQKLNAKEFGVPQSRERVIILGFKQGLPSPAYPEPNGPEVSSWEAIKDLPTDLEEAQLDDGTYTGDLSEFSEYVKKINSAKHLSDQSVNGISGLEPVDHTDRVKERFANVEPGEVDEVSRYPRLKKDEPSNTLRAGSSRDRGTHTPARPIHPVAPRCITVREAARLQSFPDWFQFHPTKYYGLRQIGNSVPPMVAKSIAQEIQVCFNKLDQTMTTHD